MMALWTYAAAFALGAAHALEVDHMVAMNAFLGNRPRVGAAVGYGVRWGIGHSAVVVLVGVALAASGATLPDGVARWGEAGVGLMLIALGVWAGRAAQRLHVHAPGEHGGHAHLHAHSPAGHPHGHTGGDGRRHHRHLTTIVGAVHGLVGTAPVVALIPVTFMSSGAAALGYLAAFALGTVLAMGAYAGIAAAAAGRVIRSVRAARWLAWGTAGCSVLVGVLWMGRALR